MKKKLYSILVLIVPLLLGSCQTEGDTIDTGYLLLRSRLVFSGEHLSPYTVTYNGQDINKTYFPRTETKGTLQVLFTETGEKGLDTEITVEGSQTIELIKLPGKSLEIYHANDYLTFSSSLVLFEGYKLMFNGQKLVDGVNYIKKENVNGTLTLYKENETAPVCSIGNTTIKADDDLFFLQASENELISLPNEGDEEAPLTDNLSKVRFFYSPNGTLNVDAIELVFISFDQDVSVIDEDIASVILEKGKVSPYSIELDIAKYSPEPGLYYTGYAYSIYAYDISQKKRGSLIEDAWNGNTMFSLEATERYRPKTKYKFVTYQVTHNTPTSPYRPRLIMGTEWGE